MSEGKPKYIKVTSLQKANEMSEEYSLREPIVYTHQRVTEGKLGPILGPIETDVEYLMSLREETKYDNIDKYRSFPITGEEQTLPEGWQIIHHTSKELIGVTKKNPLNLSLVRELLTHIFNIAEDNDTNDPTIMDQVYRLSDKALRLIDGENTADAKQVGVGS